MRVASEIILRLSIEQEDEGLHWPHPWEHYPFEDKGRYVWLRYDTLDEAQREHIRHAVTGIENKLGKRATLYMYG